VPARRLRFPYQCGPDSRSPENRSTYSRPCCVTVNDIRCCRLLKAQHLRRIWRNHLSACDKFKVSAVAAQCTGELLIRAGCVPGHLFGSKSRSKRKFFFHAVVAAIIEHSTGPIRVAARSRAQSERRGVVS
jgi:hypothetical protein